MSNEIDRSLLRRHIGRWLAQLRKDAGLRQVEVAKALGRGEVHVYRIEAGDQRVSLRPPEIGAMCDMYKAGPEVRARLLNLTKAMDQANQSWLHDYTESALPSWFGLYVSLEPTAARIREYDSESVPGLLQTRAYAEAVTRVPPGLVPEDEIGKRVDVRLERQKLLTQPRAPHLEVILNESVLHRLVGGRRVMAEQLRHLLDVTVRNSTSVRILPFAAGAHGGMNSSFTILNFPPPPLSTEPVEPSFAYVDSLTSALYLSKPNEVAAYERAWADAEDRSLGAAASSKMITQVLEDLSD